MRKVMGILLVMSLLVVGVIPALAQGDGTTLNYGDSVLGEITADVYEVFYTFTGSAGDQVVISLNKLQDGLDPYLDLLGPDGSSLYVDDDGGGNLNSLLGPFALPADGTYTIVATRFMRETGGSVGAFRLTLQLAQPTPLTLNEAVTVELSEAQPFAFFSYPGTPDMVFSLSGQGTGDADYNISVRDPQGGYVNSWYAQAGGNALLDPLPLNQAGDYIIVVTRQTQSAMSGATSVTLTMRAVETAPLSFGETYSGTLSDANPSAHFAFAASRGDMLRLVANQIDENGSNTFEVQLVAPEGYIFSSLSPAYYGPDAQSEFVLDPITLESTGQFLIVVHRIDVSGNGIAGDVSYAFTLSRTETPLIVPGEAIEGSFADPNVYEVVYRMEGAAGMPVRITLSNLDEGYTPSMDVQGPQAEDMSATGGMGYGGGGSMTLVTMTSTVPGTLTAEVTLPTTGIYLFRVHNGVYMYGPGPADQAATASETGGGYRLLVEITE